MKIQHLLLSATLISALFSVSAQAGDQDEGNSWNERDGDAHIGTAHNGGEVVNTVTGERFVVGGGKKNAKKIARELNREDRKKKKADAKKAKDTDNSNVFDDGSGACDDPRINC